MWLRAQALRRPASGIVAVLHDVVEDTAVTPDDLRRAGFSEGAWLEAVFGQFYVAVVVAQLVGLKLAQAVSRREPGPE